MVGSAAFLLREGFVDDGRRALGASARVLAVLACVVVITAGLKAAGSFLIPIVAALFVAVVALPVQARLRAWGLPKGAAIAATIVGALVTLTLFSSLLATSLASFGRALPEIRSEFDAQLDAWSAYLHQVGWESGATALRDKLNPNALLDLVAGAGEGILSVLSSFVVILLVTIFALVEADDVADKLRAALGRPDADLSRYTVMARGVGTYAFWKTVMNAATGGFVALLCWALGIREPLLWGLVAFLFNFVPNVGSLIVAVPIILLALAEHGLGRAVLTAVVYLAVNQVIGSVIEPRLMGRKLGLSPLVVLLSLLFWGWVWGPVGMLLSVPLTMIVRTLLLSSADGRALGVLLGPRGADAEPSPP